MSRIVRFCTLALAIGVLANSALAATVTMSSSDVIRGGTQAPGPYVAYDFRISMAPGAEFTNYRLIGNTTTGNFMDPARLQDDRQTLNGPADTNTAGEVDTYMNTVWSSVGKTDLGLNATITVNPGSYNPTGSGASAPFNFIDWSVFDTLTEDDNDLNDAVLNGPLDATAPYWIARVLAVPGAIGNFEMRAFDTSAPGQAFTFNFPFGETPNAPPVVNPQPADVDPPGESGAASPPPGFNNVVSTTFTATDDGLPAPPSLTFSNAVLSSFDPVKPGVVNPAFNGSVAANGEFTWSTVGFHRGEYTIDVTVSDGELSSSGGGFKVTIDHVPEPSTLALLGLAMVGSFGLIRRRNG